MAAKAQLFRKWLEGYAAMSEYYKQLAAEKEEIEYKRVNVRGVGFDPDRVPTSTPIYRPTALYNDRRLTEITKEMQTIEAVNDWIWQNMIPLAATERAIVRDRYILCGSQDDMKAKYGEKEEIRAEIRRIFRKIK